MLLFVNVLLKVLVSKGVFHSLAFYSNFATPFKIAIITSVPDQSSGFVQPGGLVNGPVPLQSGPPPNSTGSYWDSHFTAS